MEKVFPFGFPFPTGFYLVLYVLTLVIHVFFMNYVLVGTAYLAVRSFVGGGSKAAGIESPKALILRDWLPFALGLAITAGVAPLLFVQILYKKNFYTANLLGFHRWMSILPVLILGYYLLYWLNSRRIEQWWRGWRIIVGVGAFTCLAWTAYSWTENHVLSRHAEVWPELYASGSLTYWNPELLPRLAVWFSGAVPTMCVILAWQLCYGERRGQFLPAGETRGTAILALAGIALSAVSGALYCVLIGTASRRAIVSPLAWPYLVLAVVGLLIQVWAWRMHLNRTTFDGRKLALATLGVVLTVIGVSVVREAIRLQSFGDLSALYSVHQEAFRVGGFGLFLVFFVVVAGLIALCIVLVRHGQKREAVGPVEQ
ncbi:MAG: hypothetical protein V2A79_14515 [Planctomycetota bacterium]